VLPEENTEFLKLFFTDELYEIATEETNRYAAEKVAYGILQQNPIWTQWQAVTTREIKIYFGVMLNMALNPVDVACKSPTSPKGQDKWKAENRNWAIQYPT
jgi:predicted branched-subunit amino acid permease